MSSDEPVLRVATPGDQGQIDAVMKASAAAIFAAYYTPEQTASAVAFVAVPDMALLADGTYYVFEVGRRIIACGGWSRRRKPYAGGRAGADDDELLDPATEAAHVRAMFVHPDWTRRGLGRRIVERAEADAARLGFRRLALVATMPGVPLYRACGFEAVGDEYDVTLADGMALPCLDMEKSITPVATAEF